MPVFQRYRYFQPLDGRFRYTDASTAPDATTYSLVYSGMIPAGENEDTEEILERLLLRHSAEMRPQGRDVRPIGTGDVIDVPGRGVYQVMPTGFRAMNAGTAAPGILN